MRWVCKEVLFTLIHLTALIAEKSVQAAFWSVIIISIHSDQRKNTHISGMLVTWHSTCSCKQECLFIQNSVRVPTGILKVSQSVWIKLKGY